MSTLDHSRAAPGRGVSPFESDAFLQLRGVTKRYGSGYTAVDDLDINVPKGKLLGLLGPSGCGKTTTLRMIAGLMDITDGHITIDGDDISRRPPHKRDIGLVFLSTAE